MVIGLVLVGVGALLAAAPVATGRAANSLRFVPFSRDAAAMRWYRATGIVLAAAGVIMILTQ